MRVGFIGIGNMGWPMAANLARAGHELIVHDNRRELSTRFAAEHHCAAALETADLAAAELVITMLPDGQVVRDVYLGKAQGLAALLRPGTIAVDMSSSDPSGTRQLELPSTPACRLRECGWASTAGP